MRKSSYLANLERLFSCENFRNEKLRMIYPKFFAKLLLLFGTRKFLGKKMQNTIGFSFFNTSMYALFLV